MMNVISSSNGTEYTYRDDTVIGSGYYACVYKAFDWNNKQYVAIKTVNNTPMKPKRRGSVSGPDKELNILRGLADIDNNVIQVLDVIKDKKYVYIVTELCEDGTLKELIGYSKLGRLDENDAIRYLHDIVKGVFSMHEKGIMHRDLNLENIFIKKGRCIIGDLGSATTNEISETLSGTPEYRAPEIFKAKDGKVYNKRVDVWSIGIIFHEMLFGKKPYEGDLEQMLKIIEANPYQIPKEVFVSQDVKELLMKMIEVNPQKRISIGEIIKHRIFEPYAEFADKEKQNDEPSEMSEQNDNRSVAKSKYIQIKVQTVFEVCIIIMIGCLIYVIKGN